MGSRPEVVEPDPCAEVHRLSDAALEEVKGPAAALRLNPKDEVARDNVRQAIGPWVLVVEQNPDCFDAEARLSAGEMREALDHADAERLLRDVQRNNR